MGGELFLIIMGVCSLPSHACGVVVDNQQPIPSVQMCRALAAKLNADVAAQGKIVARLKPQLRPPYDVRAVCGTSGEASELSELFGETLSTPDQPEKPDDRDPAPGGG